MKKRGNFTGWSKKHVEQLKSEGKIQGFTEHVIKPVEIEIGGRIVSKHFHRKNVAKDFIASELFAWCSKNGYQLQEEYKVCPERKFRYDWAIPELKIAIEYQGGVFMNMDSGHKSPRGFQNDIDKANISQELGWKMIRLSAINFRTLIPELEKLLL